ncbi:hypothetical protein M5K25_020744 [Dendrobium thyrsiflorum]|uniref:Uncharacterized protein n=1 Tax=Dendrobium thyrsiflorum TaxID=117978 RepID=A0ABD0UBD2_DENTH
MGNQCGAYDEKGIFISIRSRGNDCASFRQVVPVLTPESYAKHLRSFDDSGIKKIGEDLGGLDVKALEEMQNCHVEALSKICQEKPAKSLFVHWKRLSLISCVKML